MNLEGIINVSGKPGLFKIVSQAKNAIIIESLTDGKRGVLHSNHQANMLEEIGIYTYNDTKPLSEIFDEIAEKEDCKESISHKSSKNELEDYFREVVIDYDEERVYLSDIKKVVQWYNAMHKNGLIELQKKEKEGNKTTAKKTKNQKK